MPKPDFVVIGAMKCGTSTVCAYLEDHPETCMLPRCEPDFFSRPEIFARGRTGTRPCSTRRGPAR